MHGAGALARHYLSRYHISHAIPAIAAPLVVPSIQKRIYANQNQRMVLCSVCLVVPVSCVCSQQSATTHYTSKIQKDIQMLIEAMLERNQAKSQFEYNYGRGDSIRFSVPSTTDMYLRRASTIVTLGLGGGLMISEAPGTVHFSMIICRSDFDRCFVMRSIMDSERVKTRGARMLPAI